MKSTRSKAMDTLVILVLATAVLGCSKSEDVVVVPRNTELLVALSSMARSDHAEPGETLLGRLADPVLVEGQTVVQEGQVVTLEIVDSQSTKGDAPARLALRVVAIELPSGRVEIDTQPLEVIGRPESKTDVDKIAAGAVDEIAAGTVDGAAAGVIEQEGQGAPVGDDLGAMAGSVVAVSTKGEAIILPAGQRLLFSLSDSVEIPRP